MSLRRRIFFICVVILLIMGVALWRMTRIAPAWYAPASANDQKIAELADRVEFRMVQEAQKIRPASDVWTLRVRDEQINAWLATRLPKWLEHHASASWPEQFGTPQLHIQPEGINVAVPLVSGEASRFVVLRVNPIVENGLLRLELDRIALGRIAIPGEPLANLLDLLGKSVPAALEQPQVKTAMDWVGRREQIDATFDLADDRRIRLLNLRLGDGYIDITANTEPTSDH